MWTHASPVDFDTIAIETGAAERTAESTAQSSHESGGEALAMTQPAGDMRTADSTADSGHANKKILYVSAFSTLVENADTLENAHKMCKNVRIRKFLTCPHFPL